MKRIRSIGAQPSPAGKPLQYRQSEEVERIFLVVRGEEEGQMLVAG